MSQDFDDLEARIISVHEQQHGLKPNAKRFIEDTYDRLQKYGNRIRMSEGQMQWLNDLYDEVNNG